MQIPRRLSTALKLLKEGRLDLIQRYLAHQLHQEWFSYGLRRDLSVPLSVPKARIPIAVRRLCEGDIPLLLPEETHQLEEHERIQYFFKGRFPILANDEVLLENAYTPLDYRNKGIMPAAMALVAEKALENGARVCLRWQPWMAPNHAFDYATLSALNSCGFTALTDGISLFPCKRNGIICVPQQLWKPLWVPTGVITICLHTNEISTQEIRAIRRFLRRPITFTNFSHEVSNFRDPGLAETLADRNFNVMRDSSSGRYCLMLAKKLRIAALKSANRS